MALHTPHTPAPHSPVRSSQPQPALVCLSQKVPSPPMVPVALLAKGAFNLVRNLRGPGGPHGSPLFRQSYRWTFWSLLRGQWQDYRSAMLRNIVLGTLVRSCTRPHTPKGGRLGCGFEAMRSPCSADGGSYTNRQRAPRPGATLEPVR